MRLTLLLCNLICVCVTRDIRTRVRQVTRENQSADFVTEHFARTKPGTVPRIPASLFQEVSSDQVQIRIYTIALFNDSVQAMNFYRNQCQ